MPFTFSGEARAKYTGPEYNRRTSSNFATIAAASACIPGITFAYCFNVNAGDSCPILQLLVNGSVRYDLLAILGQWNQIR